MQLQKNITPSDTFLLKHADFFDCSIFMIIGSGNVSNSFGLQYYNIPVEIFSDL